MLYPTLLAKPIDAMDLVSEIVVSDYRTADVFRKFGINFCCGAQIPLEKACTAVGIDPGDVIKELEYATRSNYIPTSIAYDSWSISFLTEYITNVHHAYLRKAFPETGEYLKRFVEGHLKKFPYLQALLADFIYLEHELLPHLDKEENVIFPYIRQIENAFLKNEPYAALLVRTLRKPVENMIHHDHVLIGKSLMKFREFTNNYTISENACVNHMVTFSKLRELDNDLVHHIHLENNILFPKALAMEKDLLAR